MRKSLSLALTILAVVSVQGQFSECFGDNEQFIIPGDRISQPDAKTACVGLDGTLARVGSAVELATLQRVIAQTGDIQAWVGIEDFTAAGLHRTSDFTFVDGNNADLGFIDVGANNIPWTSSAPSNAAAASCVIALNVGPAGLANTDCTFTRLYVCRNECPPTAFPTTTPTQTPTVSPTTKTPTTSPTTSQPTVSPTTKTPTTSPTTLEPTASPTTKTPTTSPTTSEPTVSPTTKTPTTSPTKKPTRNPTTSPTTSEPTFNPSFKPTAAPTEEKGNTVVAVSIGGVIIACAIAACCCCAKA